MREHRPLSLLRRAAFALLGFVLLAGAATAQSFQWSTPGGGAPMTPEDAFTLHHEVLPDGALRIGWDVTPGYYIYRDSLEVSGAGGRLRSICRRPNSPKT
jgi:thiol:disulfide interchange protein